MGVVNVGAVFGRLRREVHSDVVDTDSTTEVHTITLLEHFVSKHRNVKAHIPFSTLNASCRKDFYGRAAEYYMEHGGGIVTYIFSAEQVAREYALVIAACDRQAVHQSSRNRVLGKKKMANMFADIGDVTIVAEGVVETVVPVVTLVGVASKSNAGRVGNCGRKRKEDVDAADDDDDVVVAIAPIVAAVVAHANADADVDDACSDAAAFA